MLRHCLTATAALLAAGSLFAQTPAGPQIPVSISGSTTDGNYTPSVSVDAHGQFVVTWVTYDTNDFLFDVVGRRFSATGAPLSGVFAVNAYTTGQQSLASLVPDGRGGFVVVWNDLTLQGYVIRSSRFDAAGRLQATDVPLRGGVRPDGARLLPIMPYGYYHT